MEEGKDSERREVVKAEGWHRGYTAGSALASLPCATTFRFGHNLIADVKHMEWAEWICIPSSTTTHLWDNTYHGKDRRDDGTLPMWRAMCHR